MYMMDQEGLKCTNAESLYPPLFYLRKGIKHEGNMAFSNLMEECLNLVVDLTSYRVSYIFAPSNHCVSSSYRWVWS